MNISTSAKPVFHSIGENPARLFVRGTIADLGIEIKEFACEADFFRAGIPGPGSWVLLNARRPSIQVLDFLDRLRPHDHGIHCLLGAPDEFIANVVRAVRSGAVEVVDATSLKKRILHTREGRLPRTASGELSRNARDSEDRSPRKKTEEASGGTPQSPMRGILKSAAISKSVSTRGFGVLNVRVRKPRVDPLLFEQLTPAEIPVLALLGEGKSNKSIAARLQKSIKTIDAHCASIRIKLRAKNIADLRQMLRDPKSLWWISMNSPAGAKEAPQTPSDAP